MSEDRTTTPPSFDYDVFISYSSNDEAWVRDELLKRIDQVGLKAFIDYRDFTPGAPINEGIARGVTRCRKTLLVLTPEYVKSEWCELESNMSLNLGPANRDRRRIPLLKGLCDKPLHVATLTHIDFTNGADQDVAWRQLFTALGSAPEPPPVVQPTREHWFLAHPYAMPPNFTGRLAERKMLTDWLTNDGAHPLLVLRALGGFGKSALTWHWLLNDVDPAQWPRVVWWSFYETDSGFESFLSKTLKYLNAERLEIGRLSPRDQLDTILRMLHSRGSLLVLDGFERALRAFGGLDAAYRGDDAGKEQAGDRDCVSPHAEFFLRNLSTLPAIHGKVLLTTRLRPAPVETHGGIVLQGSREEELVQLQPADAVAFFRAQGIRGGRAEIEAACEPYGYHPLSLRLLAGVIVGDLQRPGDIAAAQRLDVSGDLIQRQHHVLEQSYASLDSERQKLLSRIACFRGPVNYDALNVLAETELADPETLAVERGDGSSSVGEGSLDVDLRDLIARGLLHRDLATNRFDLHPIVRRYAYDRLATSDRVGAHARLRDYFAAMPEPEKVRSLDDLAPVIELYHHTVRAGRYDEAARLFHDRISNATYYQLGAYQLRIDLLRGLFPDGEGHRPRLEDKRAQAWALTGLANSYGIIGQPGRALPLYQASIAIDDKRGNSKGVAVALASTAAAALLPLGMLRGSEDNLLRSIALCREIEDEFWEAVGHQYLGWLHAYRGAWPESLAELATALAIFERQDETQSQGVVLAFESLRGLFQRRSVIATTGSKSRIADLESTIEPARRALELALAGNPKIGGAAVSKDLIRANWLLGAIHREADELHKAERYLHEALERCRHINAVADEADILIDLARLRIASAAPDEAQTLAEEALAITERSGYVLQGADAHLVLAQLARDRGDAESLRAHATEALLLATCDGPPDYIYKAAYDEATALLKG